MKKILYVSLLVFLFGYIILGCVQSGTIQGTVTDSNGAPVPGTKITTSSEEYTATADSEGEYVIEDVEIGEYTVTASSSGLTDSTIVRMGGGLLNCQGANYDFVISSAGWIALVSPISGTYSDDQGYVFAKKNSTFAVTGDIYFYQTSVTIENDVIINFLAGNSITFGEDTDVTFGTNVDFTKSGGDMMSKNIVFENGSKVVLDDVSYVASDMMDSFMFKGDADIKNCNISNVEIYGAGDVEYSDFKSFWVRDNGYADVTRCNIMNIELEDNSTIHISSSNLTYSTTGFYFRNKTPNAINARYNYWYVTDGGSIDARIEDNESGGNPSRGIVSYNPFEMTMVAPAGPQ